MFGMPQQPRDRSRSPPQGGVPNRGGDWFCPQCHDHQFAKNSCCRNCGAAKPEDPSACGPPDAATFLKDHIIDDAVLLRFLSLTPDQQLIVIMRGTLSGARDPSAVLSSRITQVLQGTMTASNPNPRSSPVAQPNPAAPMMQMMMQMMGQMTGTVPGMTVGGKGAGMAIVPRSGDWYCQQCGDHQFAKNALCRSCGAARPTDGTEGIPPSAEKFIAMHPALEEHAISKFRMLDPASQTIVIKRGSLIGSRDSSNPTAVLLGRIKTVQQQALAGGGMGSQQQMGGRMGGMHQMGTGVPGNGIQPSANDWYCPNCYDLQFRNNDVCRICGTSREFGVKDISSLDPNTFLAGHQIEQNAVEQFRSLPEEQKKIVMSGGSLHGARDPTAVLINRMAKARSGQGGKGAMAPQQMQQQGGGADMQQMMMQQMMQMMQQAAQQQQPQQQLGMQQMQQPMQQMQMQQPMNQMQLAELQLQQQLGQQQMGGFVAGQTDLGGYGQLS